MPLKEESCTLRLVLVAPLHLIDQMSCVKSAPSVPSPLHDVVNGDRDVDQDVDQEDEAETKADQQVIVFFRQPVLLCSGLRVSDSLIRRRLLHRLLHSTAAVAVA